MKNPFAATPWLLLTMLVCYGTAHAAVITVGVFEEDGPVAGAEITLVNADNNVILKRGHSAADGTFQFTVQPGHFNIGASKPSYIDQWTGGVMVQQEDISLRIKLVNEAFTQDKPAAGDCD
ncbi:MAG: carboxypeptidase regulatory-like domain-containing protein [Gammaproteobacteria bacterium]|nr:carboxypeptidase regulatory-like domain-containing protein [Gammaproteobacteria bacterium]